MSERVLATQPEFAKGATIFRAEATVAVESVHPDERELAERIIEANCRAVILGVERYQGPLYEALGQTGGPAGAIIARYGVGHDGIDKVLAGRNNIIVTNTPGVLDISVAEHTLWLLGCLARRIAQLDGNVRKNDFAGETGLELSGKTLAVIGLGAIGRRVAKMAHFGLGMTVLAADCRPVEQLAEDSGKTVAEIEAEFGVHQCTTDVDSALRAADVVSLHIRATPETQDFIDARRLRLFKPGALLINTARGALVDENALHDALADGRLGGAALDVFKTEPYRPRDRHRDLRALRNTVLTPHVASNTCEVNARMARCCLANIHAFLGGRHDELTRVD